MENRSFGAVARLLHEWQAGNHDALGQLTPLMYQQLRRLARAYMRGERAGHTLQPTALLNEALTRLAGSPVQFQDGKHFYASCARLMRHILVDHAKARQRLKRIGTGEHLPLDEDTDSVGQSEVDILELDDALSKLERFGARPARAFELKYFGGLTTIEVAAMLGVSEATVDRDLRFAKAWMLAELRSRK